MSVFVVEGVVRELLVSMKEGTSFGVWDFGLFLLGYAYMRDLNELSDRTWTWTYIVNIDKNYWRLRNAMEQLSHNF